MLGDAGRGDLAVWVPFLVLKCCFAFRIQLTFNAESFPLKWSHTRFSVKLLFPKGPCTQIAYTLGPMCLYREDRIRAGTGAPFARRKEQHHILYRNEHVTMTLLLTSGSNHTISL